MSVQVIPVAWLHTGGCGGGANGCDKGLNSTQPSVLFASSNLTYYDKGSGVGALWELAT